MFLVWSCWCQETTRSKQRKIWHSSCCCSFSFLNFTLQLLRWLKGVLPSTSLNGVQIQSNTLYPFICYSDLFLYSCIHIWTKLLKTSWNFQELHKTGWIWGWIRTCIFFKMRTVKTSGQPSVCIWHWYKCNNHHRLCALSAVMQISVAFFKLQPATLFMRLRRLLTVRRVKQKSRKYFWGKGLENSLKFWELIWREKIHKKQKYRLYILQELTFIPQK